MPEDQLANLPPEIRTMVMTGANALMANGRPAPPAAMISAVPMNPHHAMMDMSTMGGMNMGQMDMGMNPAGGGMGMPMQPGGGPPMMPDGSGVGVGVGVGSSTPDPTAVAQMGLGDGFGGTPNHQGMMGLGIAGEFGMQVYCVS
jgi:pre-mRNA 3'-end-processing factor FIP1